MNWYIIFVRTGSENKVKHALKNTFNGNIIKPFIPLHEILLKFSGKIKREFKVLFPGYLFVESSLAEIDFIEFIKPFLKNLQDFISFVRYSNFEIALKESEKQMLLRLCNDKNQILSSVGIIEGENIIILNGPLKGIESKVKKINRHKRQAWLELEFMGSSRLVCVGLDIIRKSL
jgi:transcription termination/antitermination protein NusG